MPQHPEFGRSRGFCFITFEDAADAKQTIKEMDGKEYDGGYGKRFLRVSTPEVRGQTVGGECRFYKSPAGCFNGANCRFKHVGAGRVNEPPGPGNSRRFDGPRGGGFNGPPPPHRGGGGGYGPP